MSRKLTWPNRRDAGGGYVEYMLLGLLVLTMGIASLKNIGLTNKLSLCEAKLEGSICQTDPASDECTEGRNAIQTLKSDISNAAAWQKLEWANICDAS